MVLSLGVFVTIFLAGMLAGYGVRALVSSRRRAAARQRYIETGSYRRAA
jgi:hypothetical protein